MKRAVIGVLLVWAADLIKINKPTGLLTALEVSFGIIGWILIVYGVIFGVLDVSRNNYQEKKRKQ